VRGGPFFFPIAGPRAAASALRQPNTLHAGCWTACSLVATATHSIGLSHQTEETTPAPRYNTSAARTSLPGTSAGQRRINVFCRACLGGKWCGQARVMRRLRTCPLGQLQGNGQSCFPYLPREQHAKLTASAGVTDVTGHASPRSSFFGREPAMKSRPSPSRDQRGPLHYYRVRPPIRSPDRNVPNTAFLTMSPGTYSGNARSRYR
jgi:hypothetical protein